MERLKACLKKDGVVDFDYKLNIDINGINPLKLA